MLKGFRDFLFRGNVVDLAVAVVIGAAFNSVVDGFIQSFIDPLIALILGGAGASIESATVYGFPVGVFFSALITFVLKAAVVYFFVVRPFSGFAAKLAANNPPPPDVQLLAEIRDLQKQQVSALTAGDRRATQLSSD